MGNNTKIVYKLLYLAIDGEKSDIFHKKFNEKSFGILTLLITDNMKFGGYTEVNKYYKENNLNRIPYEIMLNIKKMQNLFVFHSI